MKSVTKKFNKALTLLLAFAMVITSITVTSPVTAQAAAKKKIVKSVSVAKTATVEVGKSTTVKATVKATKKVAAKDLRVTAKSSDKAVATVKVAKKPAKKANKGVSQLKITGVKAGTAKITVTAKNVNKKGKAVKKTITVTVNGAAAPAPSASAAPSAAPSANPNEVAVESVQATIEPAGAISVGGGAQIVASVLPSNATNQTLTYTSSDPTVATVNAAGAIVGQKPGTAKITVASANGKTAEVNITVVAVAVTGIALDKEAVELTITGTTTLNATISPSNASNKNIKWSSDDETIAKVDQDGKITGYAVGTTTIKATTEEGGKVATCVVTVKAESIVADGASIEVTNAYVDNTGFKYDSTVLTGSDMDVRVRVMNAGKPVGNALVNLSMEGIHGSWSGSEDEFEIREPNVTTDNDGYANFVIGMTSDAKKNPAYERAAVCGLFQSYKLTASISKVNTEIPAVSLPVRFATIQIPGIDVVNDPTEALQYEGTHGGLYTTDIINGEKTVEYVTSNMRSHKEDNVDNSVVMDVTPIIVLPALVGEEHRDNWEVKFPYNNQSGISGSYSVYNDATNETTTTEILNVPAGLQYLTVYLNKLLLSDYTAMYVDLYEAGVCIDHKEYTSEVNGTETVQVSKSTNSECRLVISIVSEGQVDASNEGYEITKVVGKWANLTVYYPEVLPLMDTVKWTDVSNELVYETHAMPYSMAKDYISSTNSYNDEDVYSYSYKVPSFPFVGNAVIDVKNKVTGKVDARFLYPTINQQDSFGDYLNVNDLVAKNADGKATQASNDEADARVGTLVVNDKQQVVIDSQVSGITAVKADISIKGLKSKELNNQNGGEQYSFVQWSPLPNASDVTEVPDFYAIESQKVTVIAQLKDRGSKMDVSQKGAQIDFFSDTDLHIDTLNQSVGNNVSVVSIASTVTDANGQVKLELRGPALAYIKGLTAESPNYNVELIIKDQRMTKANIYWIDLGLEFTDSSVDYDFIDRTLPKTHPNYKKNVNPTTTVNFNNEGAPIDRVTNTPAGKTWYIGYLPVARGEGVRYAGDPFTGEKYEFKSISNLKLNYSKDDTSADAEGYQKAVTDEYTQKDNVLTISSSTLGRTVVTGEIDISNTDPSKVVFTFYELDEFGDYVLDEDGNPKTVSFNNVGEGPSTSLTQTGLKLKIDWTEVGIKMALIVPDQTTLNENEDTVVYVEVRDQLNNLLKNKKINAKVNGLHSIDTTIVTNDDGIAALPIPAPHTTGASSATFTIGNNDATADVSLEYMTDSTGITFELGDVKVVGNNQLSITYSNRVNANTIVANLFKFEQVGATDITYEVKEAKAGKNNNEIIITLDKDIQNTTADHKLTVASYTADNGIVYNLMDINGKKMPATESKTFKPSEAK